MNARATVQAILDEIQFRFDIFPGKDYQPLPWIGLNHARRGEGTLARWEAINESLAGLSITSGMDVGCNMGYFCFALAHKGIPMLGIDLDRRYIRIAEYASRKLNLSGVGFALLAVDLQTIDLLPKTDLVLLLSIWHHWVKAYGLTVASRMLSALWSKCDKVMYFETGEQEMTTDFGLSIMGDAPQAWLEAYLSQTCKDSNVKPMGIFKAFAPNGNENRNVAYRNMFKITRLTL